MNKRTLALLLGNAILDALNSQGLEVTVKEDGQPKPNREQPGSTPEPSKPKSGEEKPDKLTSKTRVKRTKKRKKRKSQKKTKQSQNKTQVLNLKKQELQVREKTLPKKKDQQEPSPPSQAGQSQDSTKLNFYEARDFLMTQANPGEVMSDMLKKGEINEKMVFALSKELRRLGHTV